MAVRRFYIFTRLYLINKQRECILICYSRKVAKKELYSWELLKKMREVKGSKKWEKRRRWERKEGEEGALVREMRTAHFRGNGVENIEFQRLDQTFSNAPQAAITFAMRRLAAVWANISRALSSRSGLRAHFTFLPRQKHFTFARQLRSLIARSYPRKNFTHSAHLCRTGVYKSAWESDAFSYRFERRRRR